MTLPFFRSEFALDPWLPEEGTQSEQLAVPSLTQPFYNNVLDVKATVSAKDTELIFSTNGNWLAGLLALLENHYFPENPSVKESYLITTSPPISTAQMKTGLVKVGNVMYTDAEPHLVAGPGGFLNGFEEAGFGGGDRIPIVKTYGNVILKRKGDKSVMGFRDLGCIEPGRFASSDPAEGGSYNNYKGSVYNIALNNPELLGVSADAAEQAALELQEHLFDKVGVATIGAPMHRSLPHSVATGMADAGLFFLHLAVMAMRENPGVFEAIYLDGSGRITDDPEELAKGQEPLEGNRVGTFFVLKTTTPVNDAQEKASKNFIDALQSDAFKDILVKVGLRSP